MPGSKSQPPTSHRTGILLAGKLALLKKLGEGGTGTVYEAEDTWIGRRVAVKVLHSHLTERADVLARFKREARANAMSHHPNIVAVLEVGQNPDGTPYIVQELLEGETLRERVIARGRLPISEVLDLLLPIFGALSTAHKNGVIHRDLKPENIFLSKTPEGATVPKLIDFGVAKILSTERATLAGTLVGTPMYMSPEQARGLDGDARTDVWAAGVMMYELFSDTYPFEGPNGQAVLAKIRTEAAPPLRRRRRDLPPALAAIVHRALERDPEGRWASMDELLAALVDFADRAEPKEAEKHARAVTPPQEIAIAPWSDVSLVTDPAWAQPVAQPDLGVPEVTQAFTLTKRLINAEAHAAAASNALGVNDLETAVAEAGRALACRGTTADLRGRMYLIQGISHRWTGRYQEAERCSAEALALLTRGTTGWYAALGHLAVVAGYLGKGEGLPKLAESLAKLERTGPVSPAHVVAACRLAVSLVRAGSTEAASSCLATARASAEKGAEHQPVVRAWVEVARAELTVHAGDPAGYIEALESAIASFGEAGDARNACLQRANIANGYMQLGAFARAKAVLREAIGVGEPMRLSFIAPARANLGLTLARLGDVDQALEVEQAALEQCRAEGYRRFEAGAHIYMAVILGLRDDPRGAEKELKEAERAAAGVPALRALALAYLADLALNRKAARIARTAADEAMAIFEALGGVEEGESLIRLVHALSLEANGDIQGAVRAIAEARRRLLERAGHVSDPRLRRSFLDHIPENARTLTAAIRLGGLAR